MRKNNGFGATKAIHHQMEDIDIYPVTNSQLDELEKGDNADLFLEIGLCLLSIFASFLCSLIVLDFTTTPKAFIFFLIICSVTGLCSLVMLTLWGRNRKNKSRIIQKIKALKIVE